MSPSNNSAACSVCFGSGFDVAGRPCPFAPHIEAATLRQNPERGVTEAMVERARLAVMASSGFEPGSDGYINDDAIRAALEAALSAEPAAQGEAVNVPGYDVGWKIRGVTAYDEAKRKGYRHPECVEAAIKAAPPAQPAERVPAGWRVSACTSSRPRDGDKWEVYDPSGSGGVVSDFDICDPMVRKLLDALASPAPSEGGKGVDGLCIRNPAPNAAAPSTALSPTATVYLNAKDAR